MNAGARRLWGKARKKDLSQASLRQAIAWSPAPGCAWVLLPMWSALTCGWQGWLAGVRMPAGFPSLRCALDSPLAALVDLSSVRAAGHLVGTESLTFPAVVGVPRRRRSWHQLRVHGRHQLRVHGRHQLRVHGRHQLRVHGRHQLKRHCSFSNWWVHMCPSAAVGLWHLLRVVHQLRDSWQAPAGEEGLQTILPTR